MYSVMKAVSCTESLRKNFIVAKANNEEFRYHLRAFSYLQNMSLWMNAYIHVWDLFFYFFVSCLAAWNNLRLCRCYKCLVKDAMNACDCLSRRTTRRQANRDNHLQHGGGSRLLLLRLHRVAEKAKFHAVWRTKDMQIWRTFNALIWPNYYAMRNTCSACSKADE